MAAELLRLRLRILGNALRPGARHRGWSVVGALIAIAATIAACIALVSLRNAEIDVAREAVVIGGSVVTLAFLVGPLLFGVAGTMDPRALGILGLREGQIARGLVLTGLLTIPSAAVVITALMTVVTWSGSLASTLIAVVSAVVAAATCVLFGRIASALSGFLLDTRRAREIGAVLGVVLVLLLTPGLVLLVLSAQNEQDGLAGSLQSVLSWTPLGAAWAAPADAAAGQWVVAVLKLLIAAAVLALAWLAWRGLVSVMLVAPERREAASEPGGLGWFGRTPTTPAGAIAARSLTYWSRDSRYYAQMAIVPVVPIVTVFVFVFVGVPVEITALLPLPLICLFLGWAVHNDVAYDNTAVWLHVVAGRVGLADRVGRMVPVLLIAIPVVAIGSFLSVLFAGEVDALPAVLGVATCLVLSGLGLASTFSAVFPYPATRPGDSAFTSPQSTGARPFLAQGVSLVGTVLVSLPAILLGIAGLQGDVDAYWMALWVGVGTGLVVVVLGTALGARVFDRRGPEILAAAQRN
ncbi:ABC transporter permease [Cnuibacter sp. UC19_7]|uniref:ABC transporter permease n=1 Tax=Cnuibacter sp. UC19_7 TaxID=3350166 RepID=UPI0036736276